MNNKRYDDELLSAIIDGQADAETVASVEADPVASERLAHMRQGVLLVAEPVPEATPERRSSSIAAALAAASPAPEVTSLAAARHERAVTRQSAPKRAWIAGVAAAAAFLIAIPLAISLTGESTTDTVAADAAEETSVDAAANSDDSADADDAMDESAEVAESDDSAADAEEESFASREEVAEAMEDDAANEPRAQRVNTSDLATATTVDGIDELITDGTITPKYDAAAVVEAGVLESCVQPRDGVTAELPYDLVNLDSFGGATRLILIEFADDATTRVLDAEDCSALR